MSTDYETLVKEYVRLREQREQIDTAMDGIKHLLRSLGNGTHEIANLSVQIIPNRRLDTKRVATELPQQAHPGLYKTVPDPTALRRHVSPDYYESLMTEIGEPKVVIK
jgi:hypothetical protein